MNPYFPLLMIAIGLDVFTWLLAKLSKRNQKRARENPNGKRTEELESDNEMIAMAGRTGAVILIIATIALIETLFLTFFIQLFHATPPNFVLFRALWLITIADLIVLGVTGACVGQSVLGVWDKDAKLDQHKTLRHFMKHGVRLIPGNLFIATLYLIVELIKSYMA